MKKLSILLFLCIHIAGYSQSGDQDIAIIPQPVSLVKHSGSFILPQQLTIQVGNNAGVKKMGTQLAERIMMVTCIKLYLMKLKTLSLVAFP